MGTGIDELLDANARWRASSFDPDLPKLPSRGVAVVTCMDARIDAPAAFGLAPGEVHVIRNAGALVTPDVERSLLLSQYALGTTTVLLVAHTDCGLLGHDQEATASAIEDERGTRPAMDLGSIADLDVDVADGVERLRQSATLRHRDDVHGFVYDVESGELRPV